MSQDLSVCPVSETTKQTGARKSIFVPSFLEKQRPMPCGRYTKWVVLACECVLQYHIVSIRLKAKISSKNPPKRKA